MSDEIVYKLRPARKAKWLEALRSGKYKQGNMQLKALDGETGEATFCCLGVLKAEVPRIQVAGGYSILDGANLVPESCGISPENLDKLIDMNDGFRENGIWKHKTFKQIARWIEENL